jgi:exportin-7
MGESTTGNTLPINLAFTLSKVIVLSINRKIVNSFREKCLLSIFKLSLTSLTELFNPSSTQQNGKISFSLFSQKIDQLKKEALDLSFRCLSFDFLGTAPDESTDAVERHEIQMPASWRGLFEGNNTQIPSLFYSVYTVSKPPLSELVKKSGNNRVIVSRL